MTTVLPVAISNGEHQTVTCEDGVHLSFRIWKRASQDAVVFIHGLGANQEQFAADAAFFADTGYSAVTVDLRGHGLSSAPTSCSSETLTVQSMANDVLKILKHIPAKQIHIFGNALGGLVGLKLLEIGSKQISSLTTGGTAYRLRSFPGTVAFSYGVLKLLGPKRLAAFIAKRVIQNPDARPLVEKLFRSCDPKLIRHIQGNIANYDYESVVSSHGGPFQILRGDQDKSINKRLDQSWNKFANLQNAKLVHLSGVGHFTNLDNPKLFRTALLTFFSQIANEATESSET